MQSSFTHDGAVLGEGMMLTPPHSLPYDLLESPSTYDDLPSSRYETATFIQTFSDDTTQSQTFPTFGCEDAFPHGCNAELNFDMMDANCIYMLTGEDMSWPFDSTTQLKDEGARFLSENVPPQVTVINHEPDFHYFDQ